MIHTFHGMASGGGLFGPPQPISKAAGGLHTGIGYQIREDRLRNDTDHVIRQNQVYSQIGYGAQNYWEIYGRIGAADLKVFDAFSSTNSSTVTSRNDFTDNWKVSGTLGAKGFYPLSTAFGIGSFIQGTYSFSEFTDEVLGSQNGAPFRAKLKVENLWDVNFGIGFQATVPYGIKLYVGPYVYHSEAKASLSSNIPGLKFDAGDVHQPPFEEFQTVSLQLQDDFGSNGDTVMPLQKAGNDFAE